MSERQKITVKIKGRCTELSLVPELATGEFYCPESRLYIPIVVQGNFLIKKLMKTIYESKEELRIEGLLFNDFNFENRLTVDVKRVL